MILVDLLHIVLIIRIGITSVELLQGIMAGNCMDAFSGHGGGKDPSLHKILTGKIQVWIEISGIRELSLLYLQVAFFVTHIIRSELSDGLSAVTLALAGPVWGLLGRFSVSILMLEMCESTIWESAEFCEDSASYCATLGTLRFCCLVYFSGTLS